MTLFFCSFLSCNNTTSKKENSESITNNLIEEKTMVQDSLKFRDALKLNLKNALKEYGKPLKKEQFILNEGPLEFRIELLNIYTKEECLSRSIIIEEVTWEKDDNNNITIWYQNKKEEIIPKHFLIWDKNSEF